MKRFFLLINVAAILFFSSCRNQEQALSADVEIPVTVADISLRSIEEFVSTTGTVYPKGEITLKSKITAAYYLEKNPRAGRQWQLGDRVSPGSLLARLEDREFVLSIKMETSELNLELAESELKKQESLYEKGGVTLKDLKTAGINYENAKTTVENARLQAEKTRITAPIEGVIVELPYYTQGTQVDQGSTIARIMDYQTMYMNVQLPEKYTGTVKPEQNVKLTNYTLPGDTLYGKVSQLSPAINADTRTFQGVITVSNPRLILRPGMFVKADIVTSRKDSVVVIPKSIILSRQRGKTVFIIDRGLAVERIIETGLENLSETEVVRGLSRNERLVISGFETLSNRSKVKIVR